MSRQVWKYLLTVSDDNQKISIPEGAKLVHIGPQGQLIGLWFEVQCDNKTVDRSFRVYGTEHSIAKGNHVGTVIMLVL